MTKFVGTIDAELQQLDPQTAERLTHLFREMISLATQRPTLSAEELAIRRQYNLRTRNLGVVAGVDIDRIGRQIEDLDAR